MVVRIRPPTCGLPVAILELVVYRDPTGCLTAFYFSPFEVRDDSNPSGDGLPHLSRIKLGGAATRMARRSQTQNISSTRYTEGRMRTSPSGSRSSPLGRSTLLLRLLLNILNGRKSQSLSAGPTIRTTFLSQGVIPWC